METLYCGIFLSYNWPAFEQAAYKGMGESQAKASAGRWWLFGGGSPLGFARLTDLFRLPALLLHPNVPIRTLSRSIYTSRVASISENEVNVRIRPCKRVALNGIFKISLQKKKQFLVFKYFTAGVIL